MICFVQQLSILSELMNSSLNLTAMFRFFARVEWEEAPGAGGWLGGLDAEAQEQLILLSTSRGRTDRRQCNNRSGDNTIGQGTSPIL